MEKALTQINEQRLSRARTLDCTKPQANIKHPRLSAGKNRDKILEEIAAKWTSRGLYSSPSRAMIALLGGVL